MLGKLMDPLKLFSFSIFLLFFLQTPTNAQTCSSVNCGNLTVDFPFRLSDQPDCCGNPNFNLTCRANQKFVTFPFSGEFRVHDYIGYYELLITDPEGCTPNRLLQGFDLSGTPFEPKYPESYLFLNCSSSLSIAYPVIRIPCLHGVNFSIVTIPTGLYNLYSLSLHDCLQLANISVPLENSYFPVLFPDWLMLTWEEPDCLSSCNCENQGSCLGDDYYCSLDKKKGLSKSSIYGLSFGLGAPIFFLLVVFMIIHNRENHGDHHQPQQHLTVEFPRLAGSRYLTAAANGLDRSKIEAYPITSLGESFQLPRPNDNTCSICLSEYKAKETIRTITDCDHYFHSNCIDGWLKLNATCPVCRNTPDRDPPTWITHSRSSSSSLPYMI